VLHSFARKPAAATWDEAGGLSLGPETGLRALRLLHLVAGETVLIEGAAGSVGSAAAQFALNDGITVIGTAGPDNHDRLRALGVIPTTYGPGLPERVAALAASGVQAALDTSGRGSLPELVRIVGTPERVVTVADFSAANPASMSAGSSPRSTRCPWRPT
jgi:NADPH:quinone reductase-like Zn-dependent oxidoreductase